MSGTRNVKKKRHQKQDTMLDTSKKTQKNDFHICENRSSKTAATKKQSKAIKISFYYSNMRATAYLLVLLRTYFSNMKLAKRSCSAEMCFV
jgi:hypothetical protein